MVQLPAHNTPQFAHSLARTPGHPQPVPPIFQPEVAARAVVWAATHRRRELWVGLPAVGTILGNTLVPGLAERYLARTGYQSQQIPGEPLDPDRRHNLWEPMPFDEGARGRFDARARERSGLAALARRRSWVATLVMASGAAALAARLRRGRPSRNASANWPRARRPIGRALPGHAASCPAVRLGLEEGAPVEGAQTRGGVPSSGGLASCTASRSPTRR